MLRAALLAALVSLAPGCPYLVDRGRDFLDMWTADVGVGFGLGDDFQVTDAVHSGLRRERPRGVQHLFGNRKAGPRPLNPGHGALESMPAFLVHRSSRPVEALLRQGFLWNFLYWGDYFGAEPHGRDWSGGTTALPLAMNPRKPWINLLDVDVGASVIPLAARVGLSPGGSVDFVPGCFGLDVGSDDGERTPPENAGPNERPSLVNSSFPVPLDGARSMLAAMRENPRGLERPVLILGGFVDPGLSLFWSRGLKLFTGEQKRMLPVTFTTCLAFDSCRSRVTAAVNGAVAAGDPVWTTEVDVVAMSMGGLVARHAAVTAGDGASVQRRLKIARLVTIGTPHRGADMAMMPSFLPFARGMRPGSRCIRRLQEFYPSARYDLWCSVWCPDFVVTVANAAPPGELPWWVATPPAQAAHIGAMMDPRIQVDIVRRLRGEEPLATTPAEPFPDTDCARQRGCRTVRDLEIEGAGG